MRVITTFSPRRIDRQSWCVHTWEKMGCHVVGVQPEHQIESFRILFPSVEFISTKKTADAFSKPDFVRVHALLDQCLEQPGLIVNSDIEFTGDAEMFAGDWKIPEGNVIKCGVRFDLHPRSTKPRMFKWGIDAFLVTPEIAKELPDIGMSVGIPCWDYWIPMHFHLSGWSVLTKKTPGLQHEVHRQNWSKAQSDAGYQILLRHYGLGEMQIVNLIQEITGRKAIR